MSLWPTIYGAGLGLVVALLANVVFLPKALRLQTARGTTDFSTPFGRKPAASATKFVYRVIMPIVFPLVMAVAANHHAAGGPVL